MQTPVDPTGKKVKCPKCEVTFVASVEPDTPAAPEPAASAPESDNPFAGIAAKVGAPSAVEDENPFANIGKQAPEEAAPPELPSMSADAPTTTPTAAPSPPPPPAPAADENPFAGVAEKSQPAGNPFAASMVDEPTRTRGTENQVTFTLKYVHPLRAGLVFGTFSAVMTFCFMLLYVPLFALVAAQDSGGPGGAFAIGMILAMLIFAPLIYWVIGFISGAIGALLYNNLVAKWTGGFKVDFQ